MNFSDSNRRNNTDIFDMLSPEVKQKLISDAQSNININIGQNRVSNGSEQRTILTDLRSCTSGITDDEQEFLQSNEEYATLMNNFMGGLNMYIQDTYLEKYLNTPNGTQVGENLIENIKELRKQYAKNKDKIIEEKVSMAYKGEIEELKKQVEMSNQILNDPEILNFIKNKTKQPDQKSNPQNNKVKDR